MKSDGGNLYLRSWEAKDGTLTRGWIFRFKLPFKNERDMGLGSLDSINLAKARELAAQYREMVATGVDPIEQRNLIFPGHGQQACRERSQRQRAD